MIYLPATRDMALRKFDFFFVDETQDLNTSQIELALKSIRDGGRIVAIGDRNQSIYSFRGADSEAIPNIIKSLDATTLPLSICYRCPQSHVELAQFIVPEIEAFDQNSEGVIEDIGIDQIYNKIAYGDLVMCRVNAPLVAPAFDLIRQGKKAVIGILKPNI
jgi:superfamily I DNA/RNA helicase